MNDKKAQGSSIRAGERIDVPVLMRTATGWIIGRKCGVADHHSRKTIEHQQGNVPRQVHVAENVANSFHCRLVVMDSPSEGLRM